MALAVGESRLVAVKTPLASILGNELESPDEPRHGAELRDSLAQLHLCFVERISELFEHHATSLLAEARRAPCSTALAKESGVVVIVKQSASMLPLCLTLAVLGYLALLGFDRQVKAEESRAAAEWSQAYWLKRQAVAMETPCCPDDYEDEPVEDSCCCCGDE